MRGLYSQATSPSTTKASREARDGTFTPRREADFHLHRRHVMTLAALTKDSAYIRPSTGYGTTSWAGEVSHLTGGGGTPLRERTFGPL